MATADQILSKLNIEIKGIALTEQSVPMLMQLLDVVQRAAQYGSSAEHITITVNEPERDGSTTYMMEVEYTAGGRIFIGCLRRTPMSATEYHS